MKVRCRTQFRAALEKKLDVQNCTMPNHEDLADVLGKFVSSSWCSSRDSQYRLV